jgi:hypothetical protein
MIRDRIVRKAAMMLINGWPLPLHIQAHLETQGISIAAFERRFAV